ncbi:DUF2482 family protein [Staphylococcus pseudintermedius]|nr:DUF2482 family protein [Staphylococcus pseudintermedius]EMC0283571.1 DUF2482 family protein [Staphylococcus pseudintermedius]
MEFKNMTEEQIIQMFQGRCKELHELILKVNEETNYNPRIITFIALDEGGKINTFSQSVFGEPNTLANIIVNASDFEPVLEEILNIQISKKLKRLISSCN